MIYSDAHILAAAQDNPSPFSSRGASRNYGELHGGTLGVIPTKAKNHIFMESKKQKSERVTGIGFRQHHNRPNN